MTTQTAASQPAPATRKIAKPMRSSLRVAIQVGWCSAIHNVERAASRENSPNADAPSSRMNAASLLSSTRIWNGADSTPRY